jgi:hypothetical protein
MSNGFKIDKGMTAGLILSAVSGLLKGYVEDKETRRQPSTKLHECEGDEFEQLAREMQASRSR